jgi:hypothetical protein
MIKQEDQNYESQRDIPERKLWFAVLNQAIDDYRKGNPQYREELRQFFFEKSENNDWFKWICHAIDIEPEAVVREIERLSTEGPILE